MSNQPSDSTVPFTSIHRIQADGVTVFYREAGPADAPVVLLLHGFPTSSFQYRHLIPRLADRYRVIAPDLPGFGFTAVPARAQLHLQLREPLAHTRSLHRRAQPQALCDVHLRLRRAHRPSPRHVASRARHRHRLAERQRLRRGSRPLLGSHPTLLARARRSKTATPSAEPLQPEGMRHEYTVGIPNPDEIAPEGYTLDAALLARPGNVDIQLDLFLDYANNVKLYPKFQEYFRASQPPLLAIWGTA